MEKQRLIMGIVIAVLVIGTGVGTFFYFRSNTEARDEILEQLEIETGPEELIASGFIEAEEVELAAEIGGRVTELPFGKGDEVSAGDMVVRIDDTLLKAQLGIAQAQLDIVKAQRDLLDALPREEVIRQAKAQVAIAQASVEAASIIWSDAAVVASNPQDIAVQVAEAKTQTAAAQEELLAAQIQLTSADRSQQLYWEAMDRLEETKVWLQEHGQDPDDFDLSLPLNMTLSPQRFESAWINVASAHEALVGAQALLENLEDYQNNPHGLWLQAASAEAAFHTAEAALARAQAELKNIEQGPRDEEIAIADANIAEVEAAVKAIQTIGAVVLEQSIHVGELAAPGAPLVTLANLDQVELTVYVTTVQLDRVQLNQIVGVTVDSFPDRVFEGKVVHIADEAEFTPRSVQTREERVNLVYAIKLSLDNPDHALKPGMPADANFGSVE
jgi:HlyD family secretion protein